MENELQAVPKSKVSTILKGISYLTVLAGTIGGGILGAGAFKHEAAFVFGGVGLLIGIINAAVIQGFALLVAAAEKYLNKD